MNRVTEERFKLKDREFIIRKFDPSFGSYVSLRFLNAGDSPEDGDRIQKFLNKLIDHGYEEFSKFQKSVLSYCDEVLPAGRIPVINSEGNFAIIGLSGADALTLTIKTIVFSMQDFFGEEEEMENPQDDPTPLQK